MMKHKTTSKSGMKNQIPQPLGTDTLTAYTHAQPKKQLQNLV
jgi:hypothetical protein